MLRVYTCDGAAIRLIGKWETALTIEALYKQRQLPVIDLCKQVSISKPTLYRYIK